MADEEKQAKKEHKKKKQAKVSGFFKEFKKFISRGNVLDMSIGVVIGTAFGAIVTAVTNIFLSICTWAVPGGLRGLITVLPAANEAQVGLDNIQYFSSARLNEVLQRLVEKKVVVDQADLLSHYTLHGSTYVFNGAAIIDWGAVINAAISFLIIAFVLFLIIKLVNALGKARLAAEAKALEEYYKKHPEERPAPVPPGVPEPTDHQLLKEIRNALVESKKKPTKKK